MPRPKPPPRPPRARQYGHKLTDRQRLFVAEYLIDQNGARAAKAAGYTGNGIDKQVRHLLRHAGVTEAIRAGLSRVASAIATRERSLEVTAQHVLEELARIGFSDIGDVAEWGEFGVRFKDSASLPDSARAAVSEVSEVPTTGARKIKMHDKLSALTALAKVVRLIGHTDEKPVQVTVNLAGVRKALGVE